MGAQPALGERQVRAASGIVDQDVEVVQAVRELLHGVGVADVQRDEARGAPARLRDLLRLAPGDGDDVGARLQEGAADPGADPAHAAGDHDGPAAQVERQCHAASPSGASATFCSNKCLVER